ncbi:MAG: OB-fold domain-containing protein [Sphingomonadales bacterium]
MSGNEIDFWEGQGGAVEKGSGIKADSSRQRPLEPGYIDVPEDPNQPIRLIASYSPQADSYYFPRRYRCPRTEGPVEDRLLSPIGTIYSWTYVHFASMGRVKYADSNGYGVAQVDFPEGPRIQGVIHGAMGDWAIGDKVRVVLHPVAVDDDGTQLCSYAFASAKGDAA